MHVKEHIGSSVPFKTYLSFYVYRVKVNNIRKGFVGGVVCGD